MRIGTTPTHIFEVDLDTTLIKQVKITYTQDDEIILEKRTDDCEITQDKLKIKLTQEETFEFDSTKFVCIQIRILTTNNECFSTDLIRVPVHKCLDREVLE